MNRRSIRMAFWIPFAFSIVVAALGLVSRDPANPAFYAFLPMTFFFVALAFGRVDAEMRRLEEKVDALEASRASR